MDYPYDEEILKETANFMNFFYGSPYTPFKNHPSYYSWKINENPYGIGKIFANKKDGQIINSITITPKRIVVSGNVMRACEFGEVLTHPDYRGKWLYVKAIKSAIAWAMDNDIDVIFGTPNRFSMVGAVKFAKFAIYPYGKVVELTKHTIGFRQLLTYLKPQKQGRRQAIKNLLESYSHQKSIIETEQFNSYKMHIYDGKPIKSKLDGLWANSRKDFSFFTFRDESYLNWRFYNNPDDYIIFIAELSGEIVGYIVTKISIDYGFKVGTICDFVTKDDNLEIFRVLLSAAEAHLKKKVVRHIRVWSINNSPYFPEIVSFGYTEGVSRPVIIYLQTEAGKEILEKKSNWHFTMADCDHI
jgi:hypothetical protein